ncbi:MAG: VWA domain-containing protein [Terriglobia bacterium]|jgi:hypothetical protein
MDNEVVKILNGKLYVDGKPIELRKKGLVYLLIDLSDSMNCFVGSHAELSQLTGIPVPSRDGGTVLLVERGLCDKYKTKLQAALAGTRGFANKALATKMVGIVLFSSDAQLYHTASHDRKALQDAITTAESHPLRGGSTNLTEALAVLLNLDGPFVELAVVVTDGKPDNAASALINGEMLKAMGTDILVVGTEDADWDFLGKLRSRPDLSIRTSDEGFEKAITDASRLLKP